MVAEQAIAFPPPILKGRQPVQVPDPAAVVRQVEVALYSVQIASW